MSAQASKYEVFKIKSADGKNEVDFIDGDFVYGNRVLNIYYYENILSPHLTGVITISSTPDGAKSTSKTDTQERVGSLYTSLPLEVGCEIFIKVKGSIGDGINFSSKSNDHKRLYVNEVQVLDKSSTQEVIQLRFISKIGWTNATKRVTRAFKGNIAENMKKILQDDLKLPNDLIEVDESSNSYSFTGMTKRPFDIIAMLAKQTIPLNTANPGFFGFETKSGFKYVSVDHIINSEPEEEYFYSGYLESDKQSGNRDNDFKVASLQVVKDQNLTNQIRSGVYANKTIFFNPSTYAFTEIDISVDDGKLYKNKDFSTLGKSPDTPGILSEDFKTGTKFHRVQTAVLNIGGEEANVDVNNSPELYYAAGSTRYNILFSQKHKITIPCNTDLEAGQTIKLKVEEIAGKKVAGYDQKQSGNYIIANLCHYFESEKSVTSLTLIRDSYGMHFSKNTTPGTKSKKSSKKSSMYYKPDGSRR